MRGVALYVHEVGRSRPLVEHNVDRAMNPASTMKLLTTLAGLELLGPNFTWRTEAWLDGTLNGDVLQGNLVLKGYGDPKLTIEDLWLFLRDLRARGLREIRGDLVLDRSVLRGRTDRSRRNSTTIRRAPTTSARMRCW